MLYRVGYNLFLLLTVLLLPWYVYVFFIAAGLYLFDNFLEAILFGVVIDTVFTGVENSQFFFTLVTAGLFLFVEWSKTKITYYD